MTLRRADPNPARWTGAITAVLFIGPAALALALARHYQLGVAGTLITVLLSGGGLGALYLGWRSYRDAQREAAKASLPDIADELAKAMGTEMAALAAALRLNDPCPLPVSWVAADPSLTDPWVTLRSLVADGAGWRRHAPRTFWAYAPRTFWIGGTDRLAGSGRDLVKRLDQVPTGRLVVLGESGAGKTGLMVKLVLDLLGQRRPGGPVPVLTSVADWNPRTDDLLQWFKNKMTRDYPGLCAPPPPGNDATSRIGALIGANLILPILDGLDEIPDELRGRAIARINAAYPGGVRLMVTCRTDAYRRAVRPPQGTKTTLRGAAGIELRPLKAADVTRYLREEASSVGAKERWAPVIAALRTDRPLAQVLSTPLMVGLASAIYNPRSGEHADDVPDPADLCKFASTEDIEQHLLGARIRAAYRAVDHKHRPRWPAKKAERWLTFLAVHAQQAGPSGDIAWWRLSQSLPRRLAGIVVGGASFLVFGLAGWFAGGQQYGACYGLAYAAAFGLAGGLSFGFRRCEPSRVEFRFRGAHRTILLRWALGTVIGLLFAYIVNQPGLVAASTMIGLVFGSIGWMKAPGEIDRVPSPLDTLRSDRTGTLGTGLLTGLALGTIGGLDVAGIFSGPGAGLPGFASVTIGVLICGSAGAFLGKLEYGRIGAAAYGIAGAVVGLGSTAWLPPVSGAGPGVGYGLAFGLGAALAITAPRAWGSFAISRVVLALRGDLPWRVMSFLEDARERGLLRQSGAVYQFRHAKLFEYLTHAAAAAKRPAAAGPAAASAVRPPTGPRPGTPRKPGDVGLPAGLAGPQERAGELAGSAGAGG